MPVASLTARHHALPVTDTHLQLDEDIRHQARVWRLERISWPLMLLVLIAAGAGLLGHGWLSRRQAGSAETGFTIDYQRFERHESGSVFTVHLAPEAVDGASTVLRIGKDFLAEADITSVAPEPERIELDGDVLVYVFNTTAAGELLFRFTPTGLGPMRLQLALAERPAQDLPIFVFP